MRTQFVIARSEATWRSRSRSDVRCLDEICHPRIKCGVAMTGCPNPGRYQDLSTGSTSLAKSLRPRSATSMGVPPNRKATFSSKSPSRARRSSSPRKILSGVPQLAAFMKPSTAPSEPSRSGDLGLLLVGVVTLHRGEVIAQEFVVIEVALDEFALVLPRFFFALVQIGAADHELRKHQRRRFRPVELPMQGAAAFDARHPHLPRAVGKHDDVRAQLGRRQHRFVAGGHGVDPPVEGVLRPRTDFGSFLGVELAVALDKTGLQSVDDHGRCLVETLSRLVHVQAEGGKFAARQAAPESQSQPATAQQVEDGCVFGDPQRVVPGQDYRRGPNVDVRMLGRDVGHQLDVVRYE